MVIGLDTRFLSKIEQGTASYTSQLLNALKPIAQDDDLVLLNKDTLPNWVNGPNVKHGRLSTNYTPVNVLWGYRKASRKYQLDILHTNYLSSVHNGSTKKVITIHDILFKTHGQFFPRKLSVGVELLSAMSLPKADHVITVSNYSKGEIERYYPFLKGKISVIYEAAAEDYRHLSERPEVHRRLQERFNLDRPYILYVGRLAPVKNIEVLIDWYTDRKMHQKGTDLVLVGGIDPAFPNPKMERIIEENPNIKVFRALSNADLNLLYNGARLFYFVSHGEGFGLPILEAMAAGCPVITSNTTACNEIAGEAALKVNPDDRNEIYASLDQIIADDSKLDSLRQAGLLRAGDFSWTMCAKETYKLYKSIVDEGYNFTR